LVGRGWAVAGLVLTFVSAFAMFLSMFVTVTVPERHDSAPGGPRRLTPPASEDGRPSEAAAIKVVGGPEGLDLEERAAVVGEVNAMYARIVRLLETEPNPEVRALSLAPSERERLRSMAPEERRRADALNRLGILFPGPWGEAPAGFRLAWVVLDAAGDRARVVRASDLSTVAYPVVREGGRWYPALGLFELDGGGALGEEDRSGWLGDEYARPRGDPAARVTGGPPSLADADRHELVKRLHWLWNNVGALAEEIRREEKITSPLALYHVALDSSGRNGRLVVGDAEWTLSFPVAFDGTDWRLENTDRESREGPPRPEDRDGRLKQ
jgi:hypothetical protein